MKKHNISRLQLITCYHPDLSVSELIEKACVAGIDWIQLRIKDLSGDEIRKIALDARRITSFYNVKLIINDHPMIAKEVNADGVHLGKQDMDPVEARKQLGDSMIIGGTANTPEDVLRLTESGVDYIGAGPFRFTSTKKNLSPVLGSDGIASLAGLTHIPVVAIGGITINDMPSFTNNGIHGVAVASAIVRADDMTDMIKRFIKQFNLVGDENR